MQQDQERVTFSFGENWNDYLDCADQSALLDAERDVSQWLGPGAVAGRAVLDIGSGSGIHSRVFFSLGARRVVSFDADPASVRATRRCREQAGRPENWTVGQGSILDKEFLATLGTFDVVYAWGVLHHTGRMWDAIASAIDLVAPGGTLWISIYTKGPKYPKHLELKRRFNRASAAGKWLMIQRGVLRAAGARLLRRQNPLKWNGSRRRGMNAYHDLIDWLGGLPYEVATADEILQFTRTRGLVLERIGPAGEGGCSTYVFTRPAEAAAGATGPRHAAAA